MIINVIKNNNDIETPDTIEVTPKYSIEEKLNLKYRYFNEELRGLAGYRKNEKFDNGLFEVEDIVYNSFTDEITYLIKPLDEKYIKVNNEKSQYVSEDFIEKFIVK